MRNIFSLFVIILACGISANLYAQTTMPAGASDKNLENRDVKGRSVELERVSRDADKRTPEERFAEIKDDFEKMQIANDDLQKMTASGEAVYKSINKSAIELKKRAVRLKSNLFPDAKAKKNSKDKSKTDEAAATAPSLKNLTDQMNVAIFDFTHSPIFTNQKVAATDSAKASDDLDKIINLSSTIAKQSEKSN